VDMDVDVGEGALVGVSVEEGFSVVDMSGGVGDGVGLLQPLRSHTATTINTAVTIIKITNRNQ
jgi:hypothetical protein